MKVEASNARHLSAPGIHVECVPMRDLSREEVDFCIAGAGGGVLGAKLAEAGFSVVNADCRTHDVPSLYTCDGSIFPTSTAVNPSLTIEALAARTADRITEPAVRGELKTAQAQHQNK